MPVDNKQPYHILHSNRLASINACTNFQASPRKYHVMWLSRLASGYALLASLLLFISTEAQTAYQSIYTVDAFAAQPTCVQNCFTVGYPNIECYTDVLGSFLGCPNAPCATAFAAVDSCYCRGDLQAAANELLGLCINELCSVGDNSVNLATAVSIYSDYCQERGFSAAPASTTATTTKAKGNAAGSTTPGLQPGAKLTSPLSASPSDTAPSSTSSSGNNTLIVVAASVGALLVIIVLIAAIFYWKPWQPRQPRACLKDHLQMDSTARLSIISGSASTFHAGHAPFASPGSAVGPDPSMIMSDVGTNQRSLAGRGQGYPYR